MHIEYSVPCCGASSGELELSTCTCILSTVYLAVVLHLAGELELSTCILSTVYLAVVLHLEGWSYLHAY